MDLVKQLYIEKYRRELMGLQIYMLNFKNIQKMLNEKEYFNREDISRIIKESVEKVYQENSHLMKIKKELEEEERLRKQKENGEESDSKNNILGKNCVLYNNDNDNNIYVESVDEYDDYQEYNDYDDSINNDLNDKSDYLNLDLIQKNKSIDDKLFWSFYCLINKLDPNDLEIDFKKEREEKYKYVDYIQKNKNELKKVKKLNINEVLLKLSTLENIDIESFIVLAYIEKINIALVFNNICFVNKFDGIKDVDKDKNNYICNIQKNNRFYIVENNRIESCSFSIDSLEKLYFIFDNYNKPMKSESSYKVVELREICKKLNLSTTNDNNKNLKKKELYNKIKEYVSFTLTRKKK